MSSVLRSFFFFFLRVGLDVLDFWRLDDFWGVTKYVPR